jgi:sialate O-acetylesterase
MKKILFVQVILFVSCLQMYSQTKLAEIFGDSMVLQQNSDVAVWGIDKPNTTISIQSSWGQIAKTTSDSKGHWQLKIKTIKAGGPYLLNVTGSQKIVLKDVLLGEVWLCSGQSNMQMPMKGFAGQPINNSNDFILKSANSQLRYFNVKRQLGVEPINKIAGGKWEIASPATTPNVSAVAYFYGKMLQETLKVPVGLICSSWGGTPAEGWTSKETLASNFPDMNLAVTKENLNQGSPSGLYNGMIHPLVPFGIKGVIWYQGENNKNRYQNYEKLFSAMIGNWRTVFQQADMPFYFVQIAPYIYSKEINSAFLRETQLKTMLNTKNTGMVVTLDVGEEYSIHPAEKQKVGERLAYWSLAKTYKIEGIEFSGPVYKSMEVKDAKVYLTFDFAKNGVFSPSRTVDNFEIAGEDKVFYPAKAKINKGELEVWNDTITKPVAVRYGWNNFLTASLFNTAGLPASSFRTDNWDK